MDVNNALGVNRVASETAASRPARPPAAEPTEARQAPQAEPATQADSAQQVDPLQQLRVQKQAEAEREQQQQQQQQQDSAASRSEVDAAVANLNDFVQDIRRDLNFQIDEDAGQVVVQVTDRKTGETIRQIPSEEALALAERLSEARSLLFEAKA